MMQAESDQMKRSYWFAAVLALSALLSGLFFAGKLQNYHGAFGSPVMGLFMPPIFSTLFIISAAWSGQKIINKYLIVAAVIYVTGLMPFRQSFSQEINYNWWDDGYRYSVCAHNMVNNRTLWGGDRLVAQSDNNTYVFQAGYRYFLALEFLILRHENRFFQAFNMFLWCFMVSLLIRTLQKLAISDHLYKTILCFLFGGTIYACKNILIGLCEWCFILLLFLYLIFLLKSWVIPAVIFLALAAFIRQNQIPAIILFLLLSLIQTNKKILLTIIFVAVLLLPLYHNLYYAHTWAFFCNYAKYPILILSTTGNVVFDFFIMLRNTSFHYLGFDWGRAFSVNFFGLIFIPAGMIMGARMYRALQKSYKPVFVLCLIFIVSSGIILNYAYFPRFEFANFFSMLPGFLILWQLQVRSVDLKNYFPLLFRRSGI